ncbi:MAG TPA: hypothetical protein VLA21_10590, partial [Candidatus Limnocylindria bacterium]|nr:hypothetical protein [Candidatus Limnocylindria bacterium]
ANALGCDLARHDNGVMVLRFHPQFAVDPAALYAALQGDRRLSLASGKRPSLVIRLSGLEPVAATRASIKALEALLSRMKEARQAPAPAK